MAEAAILAGLLGAFVGAVGGALKYGEARDEAEQDIERFTESSNIELAAAERANTLAATQAGDIFAGATGAAGRREELAVSRALGREELIGGQAAGQEAFRADVARETFESQLVENVTRQGEGRRQANIQAVGLQAQQAVSRGAATSALAGAGVRRTGSAANLISEGTRMFDIDLEEIDKGLAARETQFGLQRGRFGQARDREIEAAGLTRQQTEERAAFEREQAVSGATFAREEAGIAAEERFEQTLERITGGDLDVSGVTDIEDFLGGLDFADTLLTERQTSQLSFLEEDLTKVEGQAGLMVLSGAIEGLTFGIPFL